MDGKVYPVPFEKQRPVPSKVWKKKYACKKNKGDHTFEIESITPRHLWWQRDDGVWVKNNGMWFSDTPYWVNWQCTACLKKEVEWKVPEKKFDRFRYTIWEGDKS
jgi:hypothetical protein